mmetsp:Transcript_17719/g.37661  ORF Transcript_17719/g.37661 Transcript_17719/m.37661 type:complete len:378 (+) Transcript_17719:46-1179(+)
MITSADLAAFAMECECQAKLGTLGIGRQDTGSTTFDEDTDDVRSSATMDDTLSIECPQLSCFTKQISDSSDVLYADPDQTLLMYDWDDTLFPTAELFDRWGLDSSTENLQIPPLSDEKEAALEVWQDALVECLTKSCALSSRCVIITNARRPWVTDCIDRFAPRLRPLIDRADGGLKIIYAVNDFQKSQMLKSQSLSLLPAIEAARRPTSDERTEHLTWAKYEAMRREAKRFYRKYSGQSWKNILCIGDSSYEHDAVAELALRRVGPDRERLRTKAIIVPTEPSLSEITQRLFLHSAVLPAYVDFNGDLQVDMTTGEDPMEVIVDALGMPSLSSTTFARLAWGREAFPAFPEMGDDKAVAFGLAEVETGVTSKAFGA